MANKIPVVAPVEAYHAYREQFDAAVRRVLEGGWYILGKEVGAFEQAFAAYCGLPHMLGVANGTDAIVLALKSLGVGSGDTVITVSHTAVATVAAIEMTGAQAVLVDIDPDHYCLDPDKLEATFVELARDGIRPRAVVVVHIYGHPSDTPALTEICARHGAALVEDCAQAHGARIDGRHVGNAGAAATFSFYPTKNLGAFGDGGAVGFTDSAAAERCRALREYGWKERYISDVPGMNSRLDELHAAMLSVRLEHLDAEVARRRAVASIYDRELANVVGTPAVRVGAEHAYHLYVIRTSARDQLAARLAEQGIGTGIHYPAAVHQQRAYAGRVRIGAGGMPVTERLVTEILSLPVHGLLPDTAAEQVAAAVRAAQ